MYRPIAILINATIPIPRAIGAILESSRNFQYKPTGFVFSSAADVIAATIVRAIRSSRQTDLLRHRGPNTRATARTELVAECGARATCWAARTPKRSAAFRAERILGAVQAAALDAPDRVGGRRPAPQAPDITFDLFFLRRAVTVLIVRDLAPIQFLQNGHCFRFRFRAHGL